VGVFDVDWLLDGRYARLLDMMAAARAGRVPHRPGFRRAQ
jgi:hypothetical protein